MFLVWDAPAGSAASSASCSPSEESLGCGRARLEDRQAVLNDIKRSKCTHMLSEADGPPVDWCEDHKMEQSAPTSSASSTCAMWRWRTMCTSPTSPPDASTSMTPRTPSAACRSPRKTTRTSAARSTRRQVLHGDDAQALSQRDAVPRACPSTVTCRTPVTSSPRSRTTPRL